MKITSPFHIILYGGVGPYDTDSSAARGIERLGIGIGKTTLAANFVKRFGGIHCEMAPFVQSMGGKGKSPTYSFDPHDVGHAGIACENAGLDMKDQYRYARTWEEFETIFDEALMKAYEAEKRLWFVLDDTADWRSQAAFHAAKVAGRAQITQPDWGQATTDMQVYMQRLVSSFNVIYINRNIDATKKIKLPDGKIEEQVLTGSKQFYPNQADHRVEAVLRLEIRDGKRVLFIEKNTIMDILELQPDFKIDNLDPENILTVMKLRKEYW